MELIHLSASIITVLTGLYSLRSIFSKSKGNSRSKIWKYANALSLIIIAAALFFTASLAIEKQFPGTLKAQWTSEDQMMIPPSGKEGRYISSTLSISYPKGTTVLEADCYYPDTNRTRAVVLKDNPETNTYNCTGSHKKHDNKRALHLSVCYSRFLSRKCPPRK